MAAEGGRPEGIVLGVSGTSIVPGHRSGVVLDFSDNGIAADGSAALGLLLEAPEPNRLGMPVVGLVLTGNKLTFPGLVKLSKGIVAARRLRALDLQSTGLEAKGAVWLANALGKAWSSQAPDDTPARPSGIGPGSSQGFTTTLRADPYIFRPPLAELNLTGNSVGKRGGLKLVEVITQLRNCHPLRALGLRQNFLGSQVMSALATLLSSVDRKLCFVECSSSDLADTIGIRETLQPNPQLVLGSDPWPLQCRFAAASSLSKASRRWLIGPLPPEVLDLIFEFLRVQVIREVAIV